MSKPNTRSRRPSINCALRDVEDARRYEDGSAHQRRALASAERELRAYGHRREVFVSVYRVARCYGGPEEGGWWYDAWEYTGESYRRRARKSLRTVAAVEEAKREEQPRRNRYSCTGGTDIVVVIEDRPGERQDTARPRYE